QARPAQLSDYHHHRLSGQRDARPNFGERTHHGFEKAAQSRAIERNRSYSRPQRSGQARRVRATRSSKMGHLALDWSLVTDHLSLRLKCAVSSVVEHYLDTVGVRGSKPLPRTIFILSPARYEQRAEAGGQEVQETITRALKKSFAA